MAADVPQRRLAPQQLDALRRGRVADAGRRGVGRPAVGVRPRPRRCWRRRSPTRRPRTGRTCRPASWRGSRRRRGRTRRAAPGRRGRAATSVVEHGVAVVGVDPAPVAAQRAHERPAAAGRAVDVRQQRRGSRRARAGCSRASAAGATATSGRRAARAPSARGSAPAPGGETTKQRDRRRPGTRPARRRPAAPAQPGAVAGQRAGARPCSIAQISGGRRPVETTPTMRAGGLGERADDRVERRGRAAPRRRATQRHAAVVVDGRGAASGGRRRPASRAGRCRSSRRAGRRGPARAARTPPSGAIRYSRACIVVVVRKPLARAAQQRRRRPRRRSRATCPDGSAEAPRLAAVDGTSVHAGAHAAVGVRVEVGQERDGGAVGRDARAARPTTVPTSAAGGGAAGARRRRAGGAGCSVRPGAVGPPVEARRSRGPSARPSSRSPTRRSERASSASTTRRATVGVPVERRRRRARTRCGDRRGLAAVDGDHVAAARAPSRSDRKASDAAVGREARRAVVARVPAVSRRARPPRYGTSQIAQRSLVADRRPPRVGDRARRPGRARPRRARPGGAGLGRQCSHAMTSTCGVPPCSSSRASTVFSESIETSSWSRRRRARRQPLQPQPGSEGGAHERVLPVPAGESDHLVRDAGDREAAARRARARASTSRRACRSTT